MTNKMAVYGIIWGGFWGLIAFFMAVSTFLVGDYGWTIFYIVLAVINAWSISVWKDEL